MKKYFKIITLFVFITTLSCAQWSLKLTSNVYLRTWKLDTKASKEEKEIGGATVTLFQNGKQISQTTSSGGGEFTIMVPQDGEFYLTVAYPGCNTKRMAINTQNVPEKMSKDNFKPSFEITGGFIMVKPYPTINYSELSQDLIRVEYLGNKKAFDDTEAGTERGLSIVSKIYAAEDALFSNFCSTNKAGDVALAKPDCPLAKTLYEKAISIIPGEQYPVVQLAKVGLCLKDKEAAEKKAADDAAAKIAADNAAKQKAADDKKAAEEAAAKLAADNAVKQKEAADKKAVDDAAAKVAADNAAKQKEATNKDAADKKAIADAVAKANADKAKLIKEEEAKLAKANKEKAAKEQAENDKIAKQKAADDKKAATSNPVTQTTNTVQTPPEKKGAIVIKQKSPEQIEKEAKEAKQKEGQFKSQQEDRDAMQKDADEAKAKYEEKQKAAREKEEKQKEGLAKSKAEDEAAMKDAEAKKAAKQKEREEKQKEGMAKSKAEDDAAMKADAEKRAKKQADRDAEEKEKKRLAYETKSKDSEGEQDKGNSDHSIPIVIGAAEKYRERIKAADELFKKKRYDDAKPVYEEALMYKEKDPYAISKLAEIQQKLSAPK